MFAFLHQPPHLFGVVLFSDIILIFLDVPHLVGMFTYGLMTLLSTGTSVHCFILLVAQTGIILVTTTFLSSTGDGFILSSVLVMGDSEF